MKQALKKYRLKHALKKQIEGSFMNASEQKLVRDFYKPSFKV